VIDSMKVTVNWAKGLMQSKAKKKRKTKKRR
jgi:hypothetical protein